MEALMEHNKRQAGRAEAPAEQNKRQAGQRAMDGLQGLLPDGPPCSGDASSTAQVAPL